MTTGTWQVRKGRASDLSQIEEITKNTFRWGDYLADAWNHWVVSARGDLLVAEVDQTIVGTVHVRYLENHEAWLEGVRVRSEFQRRGIASVLVQAAHAHARQKKCRVMRLETNGWNVAAQRTFEKLGYSQITQYCGHQANATDGTTGAVRLAKISDFVACWGMWQGSWGERASKTIVPAPYGWRWWKLTRKRLNDDIRARRVWILPGAFMSVRHELDSLDVTLVVGAKRAAVKLLQAARVLAHQDKQNMVYWIAPFVARTQAWAAAAGYTFDEDGLLIYARPL